MELSCPSCAVKHRTEDHPGAFEILCVCGYSILVPDESAFAPMQPEPTPRTPTAMDAEDEVLSVPRPDSDTASLTTSLQMTPPDDLPEGMVYDPFELQQQQSGFETPVDAGFPALPPEDFNSSENPSSLENAGIPSESSSPSLSIAPPPPTSETPGQSLVERVQLASLGHLLGTSFTVTCEGLTRENLVEVSRRCQQLIKRRPWLETELRKRNINIDKLPDGTPLQNVPELVAMELYLTCFELGGSCVVQRTE